MHSQIGHPHPTFAILLPLNEGNISGAIALSCHSVYPLPFTSPATVPHSPHQSAYPLLSFPLFFFSSSPVFPSSLLLQPMLTFPSIYQDKATIALFVPLMATQSWQPSQQISISFLHFPLSLAGFN